MFSSGSDRSPSPRQDGRALPFNRELSAVASGLGDEIETVGSVAPSPMRNSSPSSIQGNGLMGDERGDSLRGDSGDYEEEEEEEEATPLGPETPSASSLRRSELVGSGFNGLEPPKSIPDIDARRSKARTNFSRVRTGSPSANDEGGAQTGLSVPLSEVRPPEGRGERDGKVAGGDDHRPGAASSSSPSLERRRRRAEEAVEAKPSSRGKRRQRRSEDSEFPWGFTPADQAGALVLEREEYEEGEALYPSGGGSQLASDIISSIGSGGGIRESRAGSVEFAYKAAENDLPRPTASNTGITRNPSSVVDLLSDFDSKSTWAGASAPSVSTTRTGGWGSALETSSALSQFPGSQLSSASRFDEAVWWQHLDQPSRNGDSGIAVVYHGSNSTSSSSRRGGGRASPQPWHARGPGGTPAHRGAQKSNVDSNFMSSGSSGRPRGGPQGPSPGSRRVAMSPHGVAMDAAMRIVEERGVRLGILKEEGDAADKAARSLAYDSQIAAPAMTSLEQRRQRAKAWAKSRAEGTSHRIRTGAMPSIDKAARKPPRDANVVYRASESHVFSSSGSETESATARSRKSSHGSVSTTPSRNRSSRSGTGRPPPPQRGTASVRNSGGGVGGVGGGGLGSSRGSQTSPYHPNANSGDGKVRTAGGGVATGFGGGGANGTISSNGRRSGSQRSSRRHSTPPGEKMGPEREKQQNGPDAAATPSASVAGGSGSSSKGLGSKNSTAANSMPNLADLLVAPLSRPIPTDSIGYLYGEEYDRRHGDDSRPLTPQPSPSPPRQPSRPPRSDKARRRTPEAGGSSNGLGHGATRESGSGSRSRPYSLSDRDEEAGSEWGDGRVPLPPASPPASLRSTVSSHGFTRSRSTPDREVIRVVEHHRRNLSGPVGGVVISSSKPRSERRGSGSGMTTPPGRREDGSRGYPPLPASVKKSKRSREGSSSRGGRSSGSVSSRSKGGRDSRRSEVPGEEDPTGQDGVSASRGKVASRNYAGEGKGPEGALEGNFDVADYRNGDSSVNSNIGGSYDDNGDLYPRRNKAEVTIVAPDAPQPPKAVILGEDVGIASGTVAAIAAQVEAVSTPEPSPPKVVVPREDVGIATGTVAALAARTNKKVREGSMKSYIPAERNAVEREMNMDLAEMRARAARQKSTPKSGGNSAVEATAMWTQRDAEAKAVHAAAQLARQQAEAKALETAKDLDRAKAAAEALSGRDAAAGETKAAAEISLADEDTPWATRCVAVEASISDVEDGDEDWVAISRAAEAAEKEKIAAATATDRSGLKALLPPQQQQRQETDEVDARGEAPQEKTGTGMGKEPGEGKVVPPAGEGIATDEKAAGDSGSDRDRGESSASAEMLSAPEEEVDEGSVSRRMQLSDEYLLAQHRAAILKEQEQGEGRRELAMHRAVYDNDVDYLEVLLDHAVAAQEELQEAKRHAVLNGEIEAPSEAVFSSVGGLDGLEAPVPPSPASRPGGVDEMDHHGNTPLLLALQLNRLECANALLEAGANVDIKSGRRYHLMDEAVLTGDQAIVRQVYMRAQQLTWLRWRERLPHLLDILEKIPDFYVEMKWSFTAFLVPHLVQAVAPSDTYRIWKRGSWLRVDSTIIGVGARFKLKRGRLSLVFMGKDSETPGVLLRVDHTKSKVYNALRRLEWQTNREVDKAVHNLMAASNKGGVDSTQFKAKKTVFRESHKTSKAKAKSEGGQQPGPALIDGWKCSTFQYMGNMQMRTMRKGGNVVQFVPKDSYFFTESNKTLLEKAREAVAKEEGGGGGGGAGGGIAGGGMGGSMRKGSGGMFQKPFWKSSTDLSEEKVHRQINKQVKATVWMAKDYPLKLKHIMPSLEILSVRDDMAARLRSVLSLAGIPQEGFPVKVSVPLMMTVKAVVTFENFRSESIDPRNFIVPREYKRSRRMSKEKYMAGVAAAAKAVEEGRGAGTGGGGTPGALDSDDEEEEEDLEDEGVGEGEIEEVGGGALTAAEILRRRAASRNAFDDDEDDDTELEDDVTDEDTPSPPLHRTQRSVSASSSVSASGPVSRLGSGPISSSRLGDRREPRSPQTRSPPTRSRGRSPPSQTTAKETAAPPARNASTSRNTSNATDRGRVSATNQAGRQPRGRSMGAPPGSGSSGVSSGTGNGGVGAGSGRGRVLDDGSKRRRSKSRGRRLVSQLKGIVGGGGGGGGGKTNNKRRGSGGIRGLHNGENFSDEEEDDDSYEETEAGDGDGDGKRGARRRGSGALPQAAAAPRENQRGHRRACSAFASLGAEEGLETAARVIGDENHHYHNYNHHVKPKAPHDKDVMPSNLRAVEPPPPLGASGRALARPAGSVPAPRSKPPAFQNSE